MNAVDYFFQNSKDSSEIFLANKREQTTHNELYKKTCQVASFLAREYGTKQNILLYSTNSKFFIISYLAIIKSGNICVPINPGASKSTLDFIIDETKPSLALIQKRFLDNLSGKGISLIEELELFEKLETFPYFENGQEIDFDENNLAEIIYTSGSTAFPKGVMISHKNLIANTSSIVEYLKITSADRVLIVLPFTTVTDFHYCTPTCVQKVLLFSTTHLCYWVQLLTI
ncbi:MAG: long-chain fatty acid--CoA ligase [Chloroflexia bacterium]|nr:long-chain fatty acid--CoA ligase [Chloroflexia bacterium]